MKRLTVFVLVLCMALTLIACTAPENANPTTVPANTNEPAGTEAPARTDVPDETAAPSETAAPANSDAPDGSEAPAADKVEFNVYSLKGPTSMGLVTLLRDCLDGKTHNFYKPTMCTAADEVTAALVNGNADIALLPANAAAALFNKAGGFSVVGINTLGVLYVVENGETIQSVADLAGKTIYLTGSGATPEYGLRYVLNKAGIEDQVTLEFKSEAAEVVTAMTEDVAAVGLLPQPFVTAALAQNEKLRVALSLTDEWAKVTDESIMVTGVTVVRNEILETYPEEIRIFLKEAASGVDYVNQHPEEAAELIAELGIVAKAPIAQKAIPFCNLVCITGEEMKADLSGYLQTLFDQNPKAVGGAMPADEFYFTGE